MIIRRAGIEDAETVGAAIWQLGEKAATAARWSEATYRAYVAQEAGDEDTQKKVLFLACACTAADDSGLWPIVGFGAFSTIPKIGECSLENMAVAKMWRKCGIGSRLLSAGLLWCRAQCGSAAFLEVRASNLKAIRLYERAGFSKIGSRPDYYRDPVENAVLMKQAIESAHC